MKTILAFIFVSGCAASAVNHAPVNTCDFHLSVCLDKAKGKQAMCYAAYEPDNSTRLCVVCRGLVDPSCVSPAGVVCVDDCGQCAATCEE